MTKRKYYAMRKITISLPVEVADELEKLKNEWNTTWGDTIAILIHHYRRTQQKEEKT